MKVLKYFTATEWTIWGLSVALIMSMFFIFDGENYLSFAASLVGVTSLIFIAKGNPIGHFLVIAFAAMYAVISYSFEYYGEMITYVGMSAPMAVIAIIAWLRHPFNGNRAQVEIKRLTKKELWIMLGLTAAVTVAFYFILDAFGTANIIPSTVSVATSFAAVFLSFRRSPYYAVAYILNDIVLIVLWSLAIKDDIGYISTLVCFIAFLVNDAYGFINWRRMRAMQEKNCTVREQVDKSAVS